MRKLYMLLVALFLVFGLAACGENGAIDFPEFDEDNIVELSSQDMIELFQNIDYEAVDSESMKIATKGHVFTKSASDPEETEYTYNEETNITIDAVFYALVSETIADVKGFAEGTIEVKRVNEAWYNEKAENMEISGSMGAYFTGGYLYLMVDGTYKDGEEAAEEANFKEKMNEQVTQAMWDDVFAQADPEQIDDMIPQEYLDMLENGELDEIMEAIPNLKVYQDGDTYSIVFAITKQIALDSLEDIIVAYAETMGEEITQAEIDEMIEEAETQINDMVDELVFTYVISIKGNRVIQMAEKLVFKSVDGNIDIDLTTVIEMDVELPKFPSDLDEYEPVDEFGADLNDLTSAKS